jgi:hypothetical protein
VGSDRIEVNSDGDGAPDGDDALDGSRAPDGSGAPDSGRAPDSGGAPDGDTENEADAAESPRADGPADDDPMLIVIRFEVFKDKKIYN